ncbi:hypothetical protein [Bradyrhizobium sp. CB3481]|uniref:hypothetical protein n=1 Tax=Bradyrhizobium sp. CB3481 TaxID=3039158 RepID=UPI0024B2555D|nr:hypothetical protein [Bradyrhizobium sp. CB3481]WFU19939.1 hypothetical protein QA643_17210 [Bradyrhizobium sp. CB3481]
MRALRLCRPKVRELRAENVISATSAGDFLLPLGFVVRNFARKPDGAIDVSYRIIGLGADGHQVWSTSRTLTHAEDWKDFGAAKSPGFEKALVAMGNPESPGEKTLPMIPYVQCAKPAELRDWFGRLEIEVVDGFNKDRARASYFVQFQRDKLGLGESRACK